MCKAFSFLCLALSQPGWISSLQVHKTCFGKFYELQQGGSKCFFIASNSFNQNCMGYQNCFGIFLGFSVFFLNLSMQRTSFVLWQNSAVLYHVGHFLLLFDNILLCYVVFFSRTTFTFWQYSAV